jgi:CO dehydrogenase maturation factor
MTMKSAKRPLRGKRILVCGKGGSGKSTLVTLMARVLQAKAYEVLVLDGDASNPEGLVRLLFGCGVDEEPRPLIEFFGGVDFVTCPVDDPAPLTRIGDSRPIPLSKIDLASEVKPEYYLRNDAVTLLQVGKIETYGQGCDGPLEKVVRDFVVEGEAVNLIDIKAGVEHFGRKVPEHVDIILGVLDCTRESISIAKRMDQFCNDMGIEHFWLLLNKVPSDDIETSLRQQLGSLDRKVIGVVHNDETLVEMALSGDALSDCSALAEVESMVDRMENEIERAGLELGDEDKKTHTPIIARYSCIAL